MFGPGNPLFLPLAQIVAVVPVSQTLRTLLAGIYPQRVAQQPVLFSTSVIHSPTNVSVFHYEDPFFSGTQE